MPAALMRLLGALALGGDPRAARVVHCSASGRSVIDRGRAERARRRDGVSASSLPRGPTFERRNLMDSVMRAAIGGQFGAAINTLREAVENCPETLWNERSEGAPFWQIAYHTLFCLHLYSCPSLKALTPARFHVEDAQFLAGDYPWLDPPRTIGVPAFVFSKADVLSYLQQGRQH